MQRIKRNILILLIICVFPSYDISALSFNWPTLDFSNYYMQNVYESNLKWLLLGTVVGVGGLGVYLWWYYKNRTKLPTSIAPTVKRTSDTPPPLSTSPVNTAPIISTTTAAQETVETSSSESTTPQETIIEIPSLEQKSVITDDYLSSTTYIGTQKVAGKSYVPYEHVRVVQVKVLDQNLKECDVAVGGGSDSCGYQVIKNGEIIITYLKSGGIDLERDLMSKSMVKSMFALPEQGIDAGRLRDFIIERRKERKQEALAGEKLEGEEVKEAVEQEIANGRWPSNIEFMIIDDIAMISPDFFEAMYGDEKTKAIEKIKNNLKQEEEQALFVFFVSTASHQQEKSGQMIGTYGHWITIVLYKQTGQLTRNYIIADSKNIVRLYNDSWVKAVIALMEGGDVAQNLVLTEKKEINAFLQQISDVVQELENFPTAGSKESKEELRNRLSTLQEQYTAWTTAEIESTLLERIGNVLVD